MTRRLVAVLAPLHQPRRWPHPLPLGKSEKLPAKPQPQKGSTMNLTNLNKFLGAATGAVAIVVSDGLLHGDAERWTTGLLAAATAFVVYLIPNKPATQV